MGQSGHHAGPAVVLIVRRQEGEGRGKVIFVGSRPPHDGEAMDLAVDAAALALFDGNLKDAVVLDGIQKVIRIIPTCR